MTTGPDGVRPLRRDGMVSRAEFDALAEQVAGIARSAEERESSWPSELRGASGRITALERSVSQMSGDIAAALATHATAHESLRGGLRVDWRVILGAGGVIVVFMIVMVVMLGNLLAKFP